jgi:hypothetical protein
MIRTWLLPVAAVAASWALGCVPEAQYDGARDELRACREQGQKLEVERDALRALSAEQQKRIDMLLQLGDKRLDRLYTVQAIELGHYTGGVDPDNKGYDGGIKVYLLPMDKDGSAIKAAGEVTVQLYDLAEPPGQNLIFEQKWPPEQLSKQWFSGFLTYYFAFYCPWKTPPKHDEITVRVEYVEYLTGRRFSIQSVCKVRPPPPATQPTQPTQPAK